MYVFISIAALTRIATFSLKKALDAQRAKVTVIASTEQLNLLEATGTSRNDDG